MSGKSLSLRWQAGQVSLYSCLAGGPFVYSAEAQQQIIPSYPAPLCGMQNPLIWVFRSWCAAAMFMCSGSKIGGSSAFTDQELVSRYRCCQLPRGKRIQVEGDSTGVALEDIWLPSQWMGDRRFSTTDVFGGERGARLTHLEGMVRLDHRTVLALLMSTSLKAGEK